MSKTNNQQILFKETNANDLISMEDMPADSFGKIVSTRLSQCNNLIGSLVYRIVSAVPDYQFCLVGKNCHIHINDANSYSVMLFKSVEITGNY